jgi:hypothetical protein
MKVKKGHDQGLAYIHTYTQYIQVIHGMTLRRHRGDQVAWIGSMALHGRSSRCPSEWVCRAFEQLGSSASKPGEGEIKDKTCFLRCMQLCSTASSQCCTETWLEVIMSIRSRCSIRVGRILLDRRHQVNTMRGWTGVKYIV